MRLAPAFVLLLLLQVPLRNHAADVRFIQVTKAVAYVQTNSAAPVLQTNAFLFRARVDLLNPDSVGAVSLKWPLATLTVRPLTNELSYWEYSQRYPLMDSLNLLNPNGSYTVYIQASADGKHTNAVTLSADGYPIPVHIANFTAAQAVNAHNNFTLQWDPPATSAGDMMQVRILSNDQVVLETGAIPGAAGTLTGSATSFVIPHNILHDGSLYRAQVIATRRSTSDTTGYPGVAAWASYSRFTEFTLRTIYPTLDVNWYGIAKLRRFTQTSVLPPVPVSSAGYAFTAFAVATDLANVLSASVKLPTTAVKLMSAAGADWSLADNFDTQQQLDAAYKNGAYEVDLQTAHNGSQQLQLPLGATGFPTPLQISNWNDASAINPAQPFTLKWGAVPGATSDDFIQVTVRKNNQIVFRSSEYPFAPGALDGRASAITFPAGLLQPGEAADVTLTCFKSAFLDPLSYVQALGTAAFACETRATILATGGNFPAATLSGARFSNGAFEFNLTCAAGRQQVIQTTHDFSSWIDLLATNAPSATFLIHLPADLSERVLGVRVRTN